MPARASAAAMSACRSENASTRSGRSSQILSIRALVNAETFGFSRRARGGRTVKPEIPTIRQSSSSRYSVSVVSSVRQTMRSGYSPRMVMLAHLDFWHCNANNLPMGAWFWDLLDRFFFGSPTGEDTERPAVIRILAYPYAVIRDIRRGQITLRAMGLVFCSLLSLIPLLALSFVMLKGFGAHHNLRPVLYEFFSPLGD